VHDQARVGKGGKPPREPQIDLDGEQSAVGRQCTQDRRRGAPRARTELDDQPRPLDVGNPDQPALEEARTRNEGSDCAGVPQKLAEERATRTRLRLRVAHRRASTGALPVAGAAVMVRAASPRNAAACQRAPPRMQSS
jgi:hypothetical protein